jgi:hypothetical protein
MFIPEKPFKNREEVKTEVRRCALFGNACQFACFVFAALGVIGDASNITLGLEPMSWLLLAIVSRSECHNWSYAYSGGQAFVWHRS